jgi:predicted lysophospholipase L1 biosynthesis ABC-type transport system permease subunit
VFHAVAQVDGRLSLSGMKTLNAQMDDSLVQERLVASLAGLFGILAVMLASVGFYGVMAFTESRKTNEIGIRMALGSGRIQIAGMIVREALLMVLAGIALGITAQCERRSRDRASEFSCARAPAFPSQNSHLRPFVRRSAPLRTT